MRWLLFLSRVTFIFGILFLLYVLALAMDWLGGNLALDSALTTFYFIGMIVLPVTNLCYLGVFLLKRKLRVYVPLWLVIANVILLLILIFFIFYLNDPYYHQK